MIGMKFVATDSFHYPVRGERGNILYRGYKDKGFIVEILGEKIKNGKQYYQLNDDIGWVTLSNPMWKKLEAIRPE